MSYIDKLLQGNDGEWKTLGEVAEIKRGKRLVKSELEESGNYAVFQNSMTPLGYYHEDNIKSDTTFIICAGGTLINQTIQQCTTTKAAVGETTFE